MKTNWQDPLSSEITSPLISGLQEAVGKIEDSIGLQTTAETGIALSEVYINADDRYRIYQVAEGKRNWVASPAPVIKKNGDAISTGFTIDYGGGAIMLNPPALSTDVFTADFTRTNGTNSITGIKPARFVIGTSTAGWTTKDCDYLCDGTEDDVQINAAIQALPNDGGEIIILDGTYNITAKINVNKNNVTIRGNGNATILKRMGDSSTEEEGVITLTSVEGCNVEDLQIDGNMYNFDYNYNCGIYMSCSDSTISGITCNNNAASGIFSVSSSSNSITGNTCKNNFEGIFLYGDSSKHIVAGNICNNNRMFGILSTSSSNNTITDNTCTGNDVGISLNSSSNNTITGNTCSGNDSGILLVSSGSNTITGNTCIRGTGQTSDYTEGQYTIQLSGIGNNYNLISSNNCMGKAVISGGGTGNTLVNNKFDDSDDIQAFAGTLVNTGWTGSAAPYTKAVTVTGILAAGKPPTVDVTLSETWATAMIEDEEWAKIKRIAYTNNTLTFYATEVPTVSLNFKGVQSK